MSNYDHENYLMFCLLTWYLCMYGLFAGTLSNNVDRKVRHCNNYYYGQTCIQYCTNCTGKLATLTEIQPGSQESQFERVDLTTIKVSSENTCNLSVGLNKLFDNYDIIN